jgi:hypothetical protein
MSKEKFDPRSLLGQDVIQASGQAFINQTHSIRVVNENDQSVQLSEEEMAKKDPNCYDVNVKNGKIVFVHMRPWNSFKG